MQYPFLDSLNPGQLQAATHTTSHVRIIAGAGSGKTKTVISRILYLIESKTALPEEILAITFTNKAAAEMKNRLNACLNSSTSSVWISTIHSLCVKILRQESEHLQLPSTFTILDATDQKKIITDILKSMNIDRTVLPPKNLIAYISHHKTASHSPEFCIQNAHSPNELLYAQIYEQYELNKETRQSMDFDDLLVNTHRILSLPEVYQRWNNRFRWIHVDEFQDIDPIQYSILQALNGPDTKICVVGDPDQTIYTWRGADIQLILNFDRDFSPCTTVFLNTNYRCIPEILNASNTVVSKNFHRIEKALVPSKASGSQIHLQEFSKEKEEIDFTVQQIQQLHDSGIPWSEIAILYRSNFCAGPFEKALNEHSIPCEVIGSIHFFERREIKDILSYLQLLCDNPMNQPNDCSADLALERIINQPARGIGTKTLEKIKDFAEEEHISLLHALMNGAGCKGSTASRLNNLSSLIQSLYKQKQELSLPDLTRQILEQTGYSDMLAEAEEPQQQEHLELLIQNMTSALEKNPQLTLEEYLQEIALLQDSDNEEKDTVKLMTVHTAKGTEFSSVFLVHFNENIFPSTHSDPKTDPFSSEEERRLFYVAMTRAKDQLHILWNTDNPPGKRENRKPSLFLKELPAEFCTGSTENFIETVPPASRSRFHCGQQIYFPIYGKGVVLSTNSKQTTCLFPPQITRTLKTGSRYLTDCPLSNPDYANEPEPSP